MYTVTTPSRLRKLCCDNGWFTAGTNEQFEKLFYANENGCPIEQIATIIWLCSENIFRRDIIFELKEANKQYDNWDD